MDASSFVMGVERFVTRRGTPPLFGLIMALILLVRKNNYSRTSKRGTTSTSPCNLPTINWSFNPPNAQHQGGIWERLVRSFRRVHYTILGTLRLTDEVLSTTFLLVKHALNSRPLMPVSHDPSHLAALPPNNFLLDNQACSLPSIIGVDEFDHRERYARAQSYANAIWSRWIKEYVSTLNRRSK